MAKLESIIHVKPKTMEYKTTTKFLDDEDIAVLNKKKTFFTIILGVIGFMALVMAAVIFMILSSSSGLLIALIAVGAFFVFEGFAIAIIYRALIKPYVLDLNSGEKTSHEGIITNLSSELVRTNPGQAGRFHFKQLYTVSFGEEHVLIERAHFDNLRVGAKCVIHTAPNSMTTLKCVES